MASLTTDHVHCQLHRGNCRPCVIRRKLVLGVWSSPDWTLLARLGGFEINGNVFLRCRFGPAPFDYLCGQCADPYLHSVEWGTTIAAQAEEVTMQFLLLCCFEERKWANLPDSQR